jgi:hypothetical protein
MGESGDPCEQPLQMDSLCERTACTSGQPDQLDSL